MTEYKSSSEPVVRERHLEHGSAISMYINDKKTKQKSHFSLKYETLAKTTVNTDNVNRRSHGLRQHHYSRDSFDRFGDDLCELIVSYLTLRQKFRFECLSKQWRRLVFNKQYKLVICNHISRKIRYDSLDEIQVVDLFGADLPHYGISAEFLEAVLRKCSKISEIYINFNKRYIEDQKWGIDGKVFEVITGSGIPLKRFTVCSDVSEASEEVMTRFGQKFSNSLIELRFKYITDVNVRQVLLSDTFPRLQKLDFNSMERKAMAVAMAEAMAEEDVAKNMLEQKNRFPKLSHLKYTFWSFHGLESVTKCLRLTTLDIVLDAEVCHELWGSGVDRALELISQLKSLQVFNIKIFTEDTEITAIDNGLTKMATNCLHLKRLDFIMDSIVLNDKLFDVFSRFRAIEFCEVSIEYNEDLEDYGSLSSFRKCPHLRVFNIYLYNICDKDLVDIDINIPNITNFHLKSNTGITDSTLTYLQRCKKLIVFEIHTYEDEKTRIKLTDSAISQLIQSCPKLRIVYLFSRQKKVCFEKTIDQMIQRSRLNPKVRHCFGSFDLIEAMKRLAEKKRKSSFVSESSLLLPTNLWIYDLPQFKRINTFDYYCNHTIDY